MTCNVCQEAKLCALLLPLDVAHATAQRAKLPRKGLYVEKEWGFLAKSRIHGTSLKGKINSTATCNFRVEACSLSPHCSQLLMMMMLKMLMLMLMTTAKALKALLCLRTVTKAEILSMGIGLPQLKSVSVHFLTQQSRNCFFFQQLVSV